MRMFCLLCTYAAFALFFFLVVQFEFEFFEFEFELNSFGSFHKRKRIGKPFSAQPSNRPVFLPAAQFLSQPSPLGFPKPAHRGHLRASI